MLLLPAALLLSIAGLSLARPAVAAEVRYDPGDKVYFTYCYAHPPALRIKPGDSVITSTRDASNDAFSVSDTSVAPKLDLTKVNPQTGPFYVEGAEPATRWKSISTASNSTATGDGVLQFPTSGCLRPSTRPQW
jgi:acetamidase/formamidase